MSEPFYKASFSLPAGVATLLADVAKRAQCSQSAVLSVLLEETLPYLEAGLTVDAPAGSVPRRRNGSSGPVLRDLLSHALRQGQRHAAEFGLPDAGMFT